MDAGPCRDAYNRWYFDPEQGTCVPFVFGGCAGNMNRFKNFESCINFCSASIEAAERVPQQNGPFIFPLSLCFPFFLSLSLSFSLFLSLRFANLTAPYRCSAATLQYQWIVRKKSRGRLELFVVDAVLPRLFKQKRSNVLLFGRFLIWRL